MLKYLKQNKQIIFMAVAVFIVSMSALLFFTGSTAKIDSQEIKTDLFHSVSPETENPTESSHDGKPEIEMKKDEQQFRKIANNFTDSIVVLNLDGTIDEASKNFLEEMGYQNAIDEGLFFSLINPEDFSAFLGAFGKILQDHHTIQLIGPYRIRDAKGQYHVDVGTAVPFIVNERLEKVIFTFKDITTQLENKQKKQENELKTAPSKQLQNDEHSTKRFMADRI